VDDEHVSAVGGMLLRPLILPSLVQLGLDHDEARLLHPGGTADK
jgi:hypothetical protein